MPAPSMYILKSLIHNPHMIDSIPVNVFSFLRLSTKGDTFDLPVCSQRDGTNGTQTLYGNRDEINSRISVRLRGYRPVVSGELDLQ
jgi:hypothetical protein